MSDGDDVAEATPNWLPSGSRLHWAESAKVEGVGGGRGQPHFEGKYLNGGGGGLLPVEYLNYPRRTKMWPKSQSEQVAGPGPNRSFQHFGPIYIGEDTARPPNDQKPYITRWTQLRHFENKRGLY